MHWNRIMWFGVVVLLARKTKIKYIYNYSQTSCTLPLKYNVHKYLQFYVITVFSNKFA